LSASGYPVYLHSFASSSWFVNNFCLILGMEMEGIYRLSGQHSKITQLLKLLLEGMFLLELKLKYIKLRLIN